MATKEQKCLEFVEILKNPDMIVNRKGNGLEFYKNGVKYFVYDSKYRMLWCSYNMWLLFRDEYNLNSEQIKELIEGTVKNTFNITIMMVGILKSLR